MNTKKLVGLAMAVAGGYMLWKKRQALKMVAAAATSAVNAPLTASEEEQFSPLVFKRGEACAR